MAKEQVFVSPSGKDRMRTADPGTANRLRAQGYTPERPSKSKARNSQKTSPKASDTKASK